MATPSTSSPSLLTSVPPPPDPQRTAEARAAFTTHLSAIGNSHLSSLSTRAADISSNSDAISKQEDILSKNTAKLEKESRKHEKIADNASKKLKELGDVQNWAEVLERDLRVVEEALDRGETGSGWVTEEEGDDDEGEILLEDGEVERNGELDGKGKGKEEEADGPEATKP